MPRRASKSYDRYLARARELGATQAAIIPAANVATAAWVRLKCRFGCELYGQCLTCPPYSPSPEETSRVVAEYRCALIMQAADIAPQDSEKTWKRLKRAVPILEREIFLDGFYKAFGMGAGPCTLCPNCRLSKGCRHAELARPSLEACGIDVYETARRSGLKLKVVKDSRAHCSYVALVLIE